MTPPTSKKDTVPTPTDAAGIYSLVRKVVIQLLPKLVFPSKQSKSPAKSPHKGITTSQPPQSTVSNTTTHRCSRYSLFCRRNNRRISKLFPPSVQSTPPPNPSHKETTTSQPPQSTVSNTNTHRCSIHSLFCRCDNRRISKLLPSSVQDFHLNHLTKKLPHHNLRS